MRVPNNRQTHHPLQPYEICVRGPIGPTMLEAFPELTAHRCGGDTLLRGSLPDQSALYGVIQQLDALGLELIEVRQPGRE
jgi:monoterpene epsilon-lactone hydrolase